MCSVSQLLLPDNILRKVLKYFPFNAYICKLSALYERLLIHEYLNSKCFSGCFDNLIILFILQRTRKRQKPRRFVMCNDLRIKVVL